MASKALLILSTAMIAVLWGCSGEGGTAGAGGSAGTGGSAGSGGGGGTVANVSGVVLASSLEDDSAPLGGATVTVVETGASTMSGGDGTFALQAPVGTPTFLTTAPNHWGERLVDDVPAQGRNDLELEIVPDTLVAAISALLMEDVDEGKGIVAVSFNEDNFIGGESADLGVNYGFSFVLNAADQPVLGRTLIAGGGSEVIFVDVDITTDVMPTASTSTDQPCVLEYPGTVFPTQAKVVTGVDYDCP